MNFGTLKERYDNGRITITMLKLYARKGIIAAEEYETITGEAYTA